MSNRGRLLGVSISLFVLANGVLLATACAVAPSEGDTDSSASALESASATASASATILAPTCPTTEPADPFADVAGLQVCPAPAPSASATASASASASASATVLPQSAGLELQGLALQTLTLPTRPPAGKKASNYKGCVSACDGVPSTEISFCGLDIVVSQRKACLEACRVLSCIACDKVWDRCAALVNAKAKKGAENCLIAYNAMCG